MWMLEVIDTSCPEKGVLFSGYIAGPIVRIGRKEDIDLSLKGHMSVSSEHAELKLSGEALSIVDLGSRTGTFLLHKGSIGAAIGRSPTLTVTTSAAIDKYERINTKELVELGHDAVIRLGLPVKRAAALGSMSYALLRVRKQRLLLCHTRLNDVYKQYVKAASAVLSAEIVPSVEAADVVLATHMSTTVKLLTAIALRKKIVTPEWLAFAGVAPPGVAQNATLGSFRPFPATSEFCPTSDGSSQFNSQISQHMQPPDLTTDRSQVLSTFLVCLVYPSDDQYAAILQGCGAVVVRLYDTGTQAGVNVTTVNEEWVKTVRSAALAEGKKAADCSIRCVFYDEMNETKRPKQPFPTLQRCQFLWLSSALLARAVLRAEVPRLSELVPLASPMENQSSQGRSLPETRCASPTENWGQWRRADVPQDLPLPVPPATAQLPQEYEVKAVAIPMQIEMENREVSLEPEPSPKRVRREIAPAAVVDTAQKPALEAPNDEWHSTRDVPPETLAARALPSTVVVPSALPLPTATTVNPVAMAAIEEPIAQSYRPKKTKSASKQNKNITTSNFSDEEDNAVVAPVLPSAPRPKPQPDADSGSEDFPCAAASVVASDGWYTALTGKAAHKALRQKHREYIDRLEVGHDGEGVPQELDLDALQPETVLMELPAATAASAATATRISTHSSNSSSFSITNRRNQSKFRKNQIRKATSADVIAVRDMLQHCFARDSERAAAEQEAADLELAVETEEMRFNEELFADRFAVKLPSRGVRR